MWSREKPPFRWKTLRGSKVVAKYPLKTFKSVSSDTSSTFFHLTYLKIHRFVTSDYLAVFVSHRSYVDIIPGSINFLKKTRIEETSIGKVLERSLSQESSDNNWVNLGVHNICPCNRTSLARSGSGFVFFRSTNRFKESIKKEIYLNLRPVIMAQAWIRSGWETVFENDSGIDF